MTSNDPKNPPHSSDTPTDLPAPTQSTPAHPTPERATPEGHAPEQPSGPAADAPRASSLRSMRWRLVWAVLAGAAAELAGVGLIAAAAWLITRAAEQPPLAALSVAIVAVRAFATSRGVFRYAERLTGHDVALRAQAGTREDLYASLIPPQSPRHGGADLLSRMVDDTEAVQDLLVRCLLPAAAALITAVAAVTIGLTIFPPAALVLLAGLAIAGALLPAATAAGARRWAARIAPARADLAARTADLVHGAADLAASGAGDRALRSALDADAALAALERRQSRVHASALAFGVLTQGLTVAAIVLLAQGAGVGSVGTAVLALMSLVAFEPVLPLAAAGERLTGILAAVRRLREVRATPPAVTEPAHPAPLPSAPLTVEVRDLVVRHAAPPAVTAPATTTATATATGAGDAPHPEPATPAAAVDGVSLALTPGKRVALVGPSGAGKSTLLAALMRLVEPESGTITVNGADVRDLGSDDVRTLMTGLTQDPYVFQTTLRANLQLAGPGKSEEALEAAVRQAKLQTWVRSVGWEAELGEDARTVSGGQLQRLALARALLYDPPVLLLDEPAEALDEQTADELMADLLDATHGRTTLLVTHRLRGLEQVDEILVLEHGRVIQRGTHRELVERPGYYRDLWESEMLTRR